MKSTLKILLATAIFSIFNFQFSICSAQITHTSAGAVDETAAKVLGKASDRMNSGSFRVPVTVVNYDANKKETFRQQVTITYKSPCYKVMADGIELWCDGTTLWQVNNETREVIVGKMSDSDDDITNPAALLANYQKNYRAKFIREEDGTTIIDLQPKKGRTFHKIRLFIETATGRLKKIEQHNYDSSRGEYTFGKYTPVKIAVEAFKYTAPKGYEVVDMR